MGPDPLVDLVVPVPSDGRKAEPHILCLHRFLTTRAPYRFRITLLVTAGSDAEWRVADGLTGVRVLRRPGVGRGEALRQAWRDSDADIVAVVEPGPAMDPRAVEPLVAALASGHSDLAVGSRHLLGSRVTGAPHRKLASRGRNALLRLALRTRLSDVGCPLKAGRRDVVQGLLPEVEDDGDFFGAELLLLAERSGLRIQEIALDWTDDPGARTSPPTAARSRLRGPAALVRRLAAGRFRAPVRSAAFSRTAAPPADGLLRHQVISYGVIGVLSLLAYLGTFHLLSGPLPAIAANALAIVLVAWANTAANRFFTFFQLTRERYLRHQLESALTFGLALVLSSVALALLHRTVHSPHRIAELTVAAAGNLLGAALRFLLLRIWVFHPQRNPPPGDSDDLVGSSTLN